MRRVQSSRKAKRGTSKARVPRGVPVVRPKKASNEGSPRGTSQALNAGKPAFTPVFFEAGHWWPDIDEVPAEECASVVASNGPDRAARTAALPPSIRGGVADRIRRMAPVHESGCWLWTGRIRKDKYANIKMGMRVTQLAHRVSFETFIGPVPEGLELDHLCRVRHCVNPEHLKPVTHLENMARMVPGVSFNGSKTHCKHGHPLGGDGVYVRERPRGDERVCVACELVTRQKKKLRGGVCIPIPGLRTISEANAHEHWRTRAARAKHQKHAVTLVLRASVAHLMMVAAPLVVTLTRIAPSNGLDSDNMVGSQKHVRDAVADVLGVNDKDPRVEWRVEQRKGPWAVEIQISAR